MITKTTKVDYKLKDVKFMDGQLIDEFGEEVDLMNHLASLFQDKEFSLTASIQTKKEYEIDDFK